MRVCDRHTTVPAVDSVVMQGTDHHFDLCRDCVDEITEILSAPPKKKRRPWSKKKNSASRSDNAVI